MRLILLNRKELYFIVFATFIFSHNTCITGSIAMRPSLSRELLTNLKTEILPPSVKDAIRILRTKSLLSSKYKTAISKLVMLTGLPYIILLMQSDVAALVGATNPVPLTKYHDEDNLNVKDMAIKMNLDPEYIDIAEADINKFGPAAAAKTFKRSVIVLGKKQQLKGSIGNKNKDDNEITYTPEERRFILGHELTHLRFNHTFKKIATIIFGIWTLRAGLIVGNTFAQRAISSLTPAHQDPSRLIKGLAATTNFLFLNEIMGNIYLFFAQRTLGRMHEKQADLTSAKTFKCAQAGYDVMKKFKEHREKKMPWIFIKLLHVIDEHPSDETRMDYLKEEADKQAKNAA